MGRMDPSPTSQSVSLVFTRPTSQKAYAPLVRTFPEGDHSLHRRTEHVKSHFSLGRHEDRQLVA